MVQAYLRGLLKPGYPQGIKSMIREEMILDAVEADIESDSMVSLAVARASIVSLTKNPVQQVERVFDLFTTAKNLKYMDFRGLGDKKNKVVDDMVALYNLFEKLNIL